MGTEEALDILEIMAVYLFDWIDWDPDPREARKVRQSLTSFVQMVNHRLMQHGMGYALVDGDPPQLIRKDNEHLHSDTVLPALELLRDSRFEGANEEYRKAHAHYMDGHYKECLNEYLKAFESVMKTICSRRKWTFQSTDTAKTLIDICLSRELLPGFMQNHFSSVRSALESGIPTVRNKLGGHGQGDAPVSVPSYFVEYLLHETATTIVLFIEAYKALP